MAQPPPNPRARLGTQAAPSRWPPSVPSLLSDLRSGPAPAGWEGRWKGRVLVLSGDLGLTLHHLRGPFPTLASVFPSETGKLGLLPTLVQETWWEE